MRVLAWSLDTKFSTYLRATLERVRPRLVYYLPAMAFAVLGIARVAMRQAHAAAETAAITGESPGFGARARDRALVRRSWPVSSWGWR